MDVRPTLDLDEGLEMARRSKKSDAGGQSGARVAAIVAKLKQAGTDTGAFTRIRGEIETDATLTVADVAEIAAAYRGGGPLPASRTAAMRAIEKRQLELVRNKAQIAQAKKARPW